MSNKAVFLDRDGIINYDYGYVSKISDFKLIPGTLESLKYLKNKNFLIFIVTNQSGIGRGLYTEDDFIQLNEYMLNLFLEQEIIIDKVFYCPHKPEDNCLCRKPKPGMIKKALREFSIKKEKSIMIGDKISDIECGKKAKISKNFLISKNSNNINSQQTYKSLFDLVCVKKLIK